MFANNALPPTVQNVVATAWLSDWELDLNHIASVLKNVELDPHTFAALKHRIFLDEYAIMFLIFRTGKIVCTGCKTIKQSHRAFDVLFDELRASECIIPDKSLWVVKIQNLVAAMDLGQPLLLSKLAEEHAEHFDYEPELFPGGKYTLAIPGGNITLKIFVSGKINITGAKNMKQIDLAFRTLMTFIHPFFVSSAS
jgi:transcription initiation factor TFIID TATA-box-binding protein